jgi:DHA1 family bicyclomycin/chloramphenicol resistance-like MFS transporter
MSDVPAKAPNPSAVMISLLIAISALNPISVNIIVPSLTAIAEGLHTDFATVQLALSSYLFATAISQLVHGPLSDKFGRRPVLLVGILIYVVASFLCLVATSIWLVIVGRILQGVGAAAGFALGRAIVRDLYEREKAASMLGYISMGFSTAPMVAPLIGGLISDNLGWRLVFVFMTVVSVLLLVFVWTALPETRRPMPEGQVRTGFFRSFAILAVIPAFWAYALNVGFMGAVFFTFLGGTPFIATTLFGMSGTQYGVYFAFVPIGFFLGNWLTAGLATRLGIVAMIRTGNALSLIAGIISIILLGSGWQNPFAIFAPMYLVGLANGLSTANGLAGAVSVRPALAGAASGVTGSFQIGFGAVATVIVGYLLTLTHSPMPVPIMMTVFAAIALATGIWVKTARN